MSGRDIDYDEWDDGDGPPSELYHRAFQLMLRRSGRKALGEVEAALLAMPEKRLAFGYLAILPPEDPEQDRWLPISPLGLTCVNGAVCVAKRTARGEERGAVMADLASRMEGLNLDGYDDFYEDAYDAQEKTKAAAKEVGIPKMLALALAEANDAGGIGETPEARYDRVLGYVRRLREVAASPLPFRSKKWTGPVAVA